MRRQDELLGSRARVKARYALLPLEGIPYSRLPQWPEAEIRVLASPAIGSSFAEYLIDMNPGQQGNHPSDGEIEHFLYLLSGEAEISVTGGEAMSRQLTAGGYALIPPSAGYRFTATRECSLLLLRKRYEGAPGIEEFSPLIGNEGDVKGEVYMGDNGALLQTLIPDEFGYDLAMNIFTFQVGHSLPVTETHVMEHGLYVLQGKGLYYLDDTWMEVEESDFIWMGPYCPQSYYAAGLEPTRYIYYKNVNREIPL